MNTEKTEIFDPKGKELVIAGEKFNIKPFVLRTRTKLLRIIYDVLLSLAKEKPEMQTSDLAKAVVMIPVLIDVAGDKLIEIYEIVLNKSREWLDERVLLKDEIALISAIWEVNDVSFLAKQVRDLIKRTR